MGVEEIVHVGRVEVKIYNGLPPELYTDVLFGHFDYQGNPQNSITRYACKQFPGLQAHIRAGETYVPSPHTKFSAVQAITGVDEPHIHVEEGLNAVEKYIVQSLSIPLPGWPYAQQEQEMKYMLKHADNIAKTILDFSEAGNTLVTTIHLGPPVRAKVNNIQKYLAEAIRMHQPRPTVFTEKEFNPWDDDDGDMYA
jgi:hypothetical protein